MRSAESFENVSRLSGQDDASKARDVRPRNEYLALPLVDCSDVLQFPHHRSKHQLDRVPDRECDELRIAVARDNDALAILDRGNHG